jgi:hypothetical protein
MSLILKKTIFLIVALFWAGISTYSQVQINKRILFDSVNTNRTIEGIVLAYDSTSGIPYSAYLKTSLNYIENQTGDSTLNIHLPTPLAFYPEGFELFIHATTPNPGVLFLKIDNLNKVEVRKSDSLKLLANEIVKDQIFKVIYTGTYFMLVSPSALKCPTGFVNVNDNFCIEPDERAATTYLSAVDSCFSINAHLCTWGQWYYACQKTSLGLLNMTNNYEYIDDTSDHSNTVLISGNGSCTTTYSFTITDKGTYSYRCCYNK